MRDSFVTAFKIPVYVLTTAAMALVTLAGAAALAQNPQVGRKGHGL